MKNLLFLIFTILGIGIAHAQIDGDNIIVINDFKEKAKFSEIKRVFIINGYELHQFDTLGGYFSTEYRPIEGSVYAYNLKVKILGFVDGNDLILTGNYTSQYSDGTGGMADASGQATFGKRKLIAKRLAFDEVRKMALKINDKLSYKQE